MNRYWVDAAIIQVEILVKKLREVQETGDLQKFKETTSYAEQELEIVKTQLQHVSDDAHWNEIEGSA